MKKYEKPRLMALSLSGNDMLCTGCTPGSLDGINGDLLKDIRNDWDILFNTAEHCVMLVDPDLDTYCKFTLDSILFAS